MSFYYLRKVSSRVKITKNNWKKVIKMLTRNFPRSVQAHQEVTQRTTSQIQEDEMSFLRRQAGLILKDAQTSGGSSEKSRCSFTSKGTSWGGSGIRSGCLQGGAYLWRFSRHYQLGGDPGADPQLMGEITYLVWPGNASGSPRRSWEAYSACCRRDLTPDKGMKMDGLMEYFSNNQLGHHSSLTTPDWHFYRFLQAMFVTSSRKKENAQHSFFVTDPTAFLARHTMLAS